jgi:hypothetical protein
MIGIETTNCARMANLICALRDRGHKVEAAGKNLTIDGVPCLTAFLDNAMDLARDMDDAIRRIDEVVLRPAAWKRREHEVADLLLGLARKAGYQVDERTKAITIDGESYLVQAWR